MKNLTRRSLGKGLATSLAASLVPAAHSAIAADPASNATGSGAWKFVLPGIWRATIGSPEQHTPVRDRLIEPLEASIRKLGQVAAVPLPEIQGFVSLRGTHVTLPLQPGELMYGFGLQLLSFQQRGKKRTIRVNADPKGDSGDSHAPLPFYVTTQGYAVLVDTFRQANFYCGDAHPKPVVPSAAASAVVNTPGQMREHDRHDDATVEVEIPRTAGVDVYLFAGPSMLEAVQRYNLFSGGGVSPPEWGLGFWYRPEMHLNAAEVLALGREFRDRKIPCDVLGLEPGWQTHAYSCSFAWEPSRFPDPEAFLASSRKLNYRVNLWEHAFTHPSSPIFSALVPYAGNYAVWQGLVPDFASDTARKIFADYHAHALIDAGVSGFKLDECDNSDFTEGWSWPDFAAFPSGLDGEQMHAVFGLRYQHAVLDAFRQRKQPTLGLVRSSGPLAAPYPFVLYSDLYDHRQFVRGLINAGFGGLLWCPEVRDAVTEEDLVRRLQTVVFSPLAMVNAWYIRNPPWKQIDRERNNADNFSANWETLESRCREIIGWRMSLIPYLRSAFAKYAADGTPAFRALVLDFPDEPALRTVDDQYMIGDRLLVAPMFAAESDRKVLLPGGVWHDFWTGEVLAGGQTIRVPRSFERIPLYVREGSIFPWADAAPSTDHPSARRISVRVYGKGQLAWHGAGADLDGLSLAWDTRAAKGEARNAPNAGRPYEIIGWDKIG